MILMRDIIREGHPALTRKAMPVLLPISDDDRQTVFSLMQYVINSQNEESAEKYGLRPGVGLAAPQINVSRRMFAMHLHDEDGNLHSLLVVNPVITHRSEEIVYLNGGEGCLSVDRITEGITPRHRTISYAAHTYDIKSNSFVLTTGTLTGYAATVFQHEYDHLDGIMYTSKLFDSLPDAKPLFEDIEDSL